METISHFQLMNASGAVAKPDISLLAGAFTEFISASTRLEASYEKLQQEVTHLSHELADRNSALKASLAENERVHRALQQIVESMPCGVLVVEADGSVSVINPEGRRLLDLDSAPVDRIETVSIAAGINLAGFLKRHSSAAGEQEFCRTSSTGKSWLAVHDRVLCQESEVQGARREGKQTIVILRDVTVHKQAEHERERARKATALSEVATTLAHEIRNPLASMELFAGLIAKGGEGTSEWISHLHAGIRSLAATVNNVLSFHGACSFSLTRVNLSETIRSSVEFARPIADEAGVTLKFSSDDPKINVQANSSALQQLVLNLVCNAIRHTNAGGKVDVSVGHSSGDQVSGRALIEFSDTGSGILLEHLSDIFRPGFSGSGTTSGLGLAVCSQIVKRHDGDIQVTSKPGAGTTFFVEIPTL